MKHWFTRSWEAAGRNAWCNSCAQTWEGEQRIACLTFTNVSAAENVFLWNGSGSCGVCETSKQFTFELACEEICLCAVGIRSEFAEAAAVFCVPPSSQQLLGK